ncbi:MAG: 1-hydroxycarotenoid 3,4-desaturase CrtD [Cohaesibacteraceae bacterium]
MHKDSVLIVGGGVGGLSAALALAGQGLDVTILEAQPEIGGKMRAVQVGQGDDQATMDGVPTVFTMIWVFDVLFDEAGLNFDEAVALTKADLLARHAWDDTGHLDLFADLDRSADAIGAFCGPQDAKNFRDFAKEAAEIYRLLEKPFLRSSKPSMLGMSMGLGTKGFAVKPFSTLWKSLSSRFRDPRLVQLFGRYSTYTGASPFLAPATLMLIAHVELAGVWLVKGGMRALAQSLKAACQQKSVTVRTSCPVDRIEVEGGRARAVTLKSGERLTADAIMVNADASALGAGLFGPDVISAAQAVPTEKRSLAAIAWTLKAKIQGFPLVHHSVFFGRDYPEEFEAVFRQHRYPNDPTVYICAQDRSAEGTTPPADDAERMLMVINAPPVGDGHTLSDKEMQACLDRSMNRLQACGLSVTVAPAMSRPTDPRGFNQQFPATGGALYGRANHAPFASFQRPDNRTAIPGLYLAGGSVHPGPGVPMAALSGRIAAAQLIADRTSMRPSRQTVTIGGTLTA